MSERRSVILRRAATKDPTAHRADLVGLVALKLVLGLWLAHRGFSHVSDDDYARTVISELFAHSPRLDPSGTSWLPFPFWITGGAMMALGRTIDVARGVAFVLSALSVIPVYVALRSVGVARVSAMVGVAIGMATPWNAWLGAATVPEGYAGALVAAGAIALGDARARPWAALCLLVAALSRYEAWPVCAVFAVVVAWRIARSESERRSAGSWFTAGLAVAGPLAWMAWNLHAHGSATHFLTRVAAYRQAIGAGGEPLVDRVLSYPIALVTGAPDVAVMTVLGFIALYMFQAMRARWTLPLVAMLSVLLFLAYGDARDGAPTHHPERTLVAIWWVLATFGADGAGRIFSRAAFGRSAREAWGIALASGAAVAWIASLVGSWSTFPGSTAQELRGGQIARGLELKEKGVTRFTVTPCAYEHFALLAAFGAPENTKAAPATHAPLSPLCPRVEVE